MTVKLLVALLLVASSTTVSARVGNHRQKTVDNAVNSVDSDEQRHALAFPLGPAANRRNFLVASESSSTSDPTSSSTEATSSSTSDPTSSSTEATSSSTSDPTSSSTEATSSSSSDPTSSSTEATSSSTSDPTSSSTEATSSSTSSTTSASTSSTTEATSSTADSSSTSDTDETAAPVGSVDYALMVALADGKIPADFIDAFRNHYKTAFFSVEIVFIRWATSKEIPLGFAGRVDSAAKVAIFGFNGLGTRIQARSLLFQDPKDAPLRSILGMSDVASISVGAALGYEEFSSFGASHNNIATAVCVVAALMYGMVL